MDADDIDKLLDEVEQDLDKTKASYGKKGSDFPGSDIKTTAADDVDALLTDLPNASALDTTNQRPPVIGAQDKKCWPPYLTGSCTSASVTFDGWQWSPDVTYLFLRTNYPTIEKLRAKLQPRRTCRAYACQCKSVATSEPMAITADKDFRWICSGKPA